MKTRLLAQLDTRTAGLVEAVFSRQEPIEVIGPDERPIARIVPAHPNEGRTLAEMIAENPDIGELRLPEGIAQGIAQQIDWLRRCPHCGNPTHGGFALAPNGGEPAWPRALADSVG